jgi:hypothetical protein
MRTYALAIATAALFALPTSASRKVSLATMAVLPTGANAGNCEKLVSIKRSWASKAKAIASGIAEGASGTSFAAPRRRCGQDGTIGPSELSPSRGAFTVPSVEVPGGRRHEKVFTVQATRANVVLWFGQWLGRRNPPVG